MKKKSIRALLLAAGYGTRLRPLTLTIPKCLVRIQNKPLLEIWFEKLEKIGVEETLINLHYLPKKVEKFLDTQKFRKFKIHKFFERELLGTAGTLIANYKFFKNSTGILIHADNFSNFDLNELMIAHNNRPKSCLITMLTFRSDNPKACGVVDLDKKNIVQSFEEKSNNPKSNIANGAVYLFENDFIDWLIKFNKKASDFSTEIIPQLLGKIYAYQINCDYIDIGTLSNLQKATKVAKNS